LNVTFSCHDIAEKIAHLALNNNHSLTLGQSETVVAMFNFLSAQKVITFGQHLINNISTMFYSILNKQLEKNVKI